MYHNYSETDINNLKDLLKLSASELLKNDKDIINKYNDSKASDWYGRKLHEVCINHRFGYYLEKFACNFELNGYFFDLEFNRKGDERKYSQPEDSEKEKEERRPDIIIHRRVVSPEKINNYLIIEAKKMTINAKDIRTIKSLLKDNDYRYKFGVSISYSLMPNAIMMKIYKYNNGKIEEEDFNVRND